MAQPDASYLNKLTKQRSAQPGVTEPREGHVSERQHTGVATILSIRFADGRERQQVAWGIYGGGLWLIGGEWETLTLLFANRVVNIEGRNLKFIEDEIAESQLKVIQEHNATEITVLAKDNESLAATEKKVIIAKITVEPDFGDLVNAVKGKGADGD